MGSKNEEIINALKICHNYCINRLNCDECIIDKINACQDGITPGGWNIKELSNGQYTINRRTDS